MKRDETQAQKEARLSAFERDERPNRKPSDNKFGWQLNRIDSLNWIKDNSGLYCLIVWDVKTETVRIDFLSDDHEPIISFAGQSDNVRIAVGRWIDSRISQKTSDKVSAEHIAYIGSELQLADVMRIDYVQDSDGVTSDKVSLLCCGSPITLEELPGNYNHNFIGRCGKCHIGFGIEKLSDVDVLDDAELSDVVCSKCGYSKSGYSSDNILMCLDCGETWPTSDNIDKPQQTIAEEESYNNVHLSDDQLRAKQTSDNKKAAKTTEEKYS